MAAGDGGVAASPPPPSFEETYRASYGRVTRVVHLITGSNEVAEEVVQDAFVALYADLPLAEIGELTGIRTGTVKSLLHRALAQLKEVVEP